MGLPLPNEVPRLINGDETYHRNIVDHLNKIYIAIVEEKDRVAAVLTDDLTLTMAASHAFDRDDDAPYEIISHGLLRLRARLHQDVPMSDLLDMVIHLQRIALAYISQRTAGTARN